MNTSSSLSSSANTDTSNGTTAVTLVPREVSLGNIVKQAIRQLPQLPTTLKGLGELIKAKPERLRSIGLLLEQQAARQPDHIAVRF